MDSSEEEGEIVPDYVTNYQLLDHMETLVSFSILPLQWSEEAEIIDNLQMQVYLHGTTDNGLQKLHKQIKAWRFELLCNEPRIFVLSKDKNWIELQRPTKCSENVVRTILVTVHLLHCIKKNPEATTKSIWNHLSRVFSPNEVAESDIFYHMQLIREVASKDEDLVKSKYLLSIIMKSGTIKAFEEVPTAKKCKVIVDEDGSDSADDYEELDDTELGLFDTVCSICDNGGELLLCEGRCMRSFHATKNDGADSLCQTLGYSTHAEVDAIPNFLCNNCLCQQHQCYACGILGSSDKSSGAEVFPCVSATCGHFYHPGCVAKLLHPANRSEQKELEKRIAAAEPFACPIHKCFICKRGEDKEVYEFQFAICRRCPKAYHRRCLPKSFTFGNEENFIQRAWDGLLPSRILIYCMEHTISSELGTPTRNHLVFPNSKRKEKNRVLETLSSKENEVASGRASTAVRVGNFTKKVQKTFSPQGSSTLKKPNSSSQVREYMKNKRDTTCTSQKILPFRIVESKLPFKTKNSLVNSGSYPVRSYQTTDGSKIKNMISESAMEKGNSPLPFDDVEMKRKMLKLMTESTLSFNMEEFKRKQKIPSTHEYCPRNVLDKTITLSKVETSVEAVRTALKKLEEGCSIEDAKAVCEPYVLDQIVRWKRKLQVYLAPFLYGMRYTSFGRHFTKVEKLQEIVDRLHCYVHDGDMVVDFCCGSNDFSCLLKDKLEKTKKRCSFKNYDLMQAKNDFCFEKRDWMSIRLEELPDGSQLIMGLNPPFGVNASLANKFINKALQFKPKLLVLIVPEETERLDKKAIGYDLIWKDDRILSGKSFYLPGSVDTNEKVLEDWNLKPPPLYLWSRSDWTYWHKQITEHHSYTSKEQEIHLNDYPREKHEFLHDLPSPVERACGNISSVLGNFLETSGKTNAGEGSHSEASMQGKSDCDLGVEAEPMCIDMLVSSKELETGEVPNGFATGQENSQIRRPESYFPRTNEYTEFGGWTPKFQYPDQAPLFQNGSIPYPKPLQCYFRPSGPDKLCSPWPSNGNPRYPATGPPPFN